MPLEVLGDEDETIGFDDVVVTAGTRVVVVLAVVVLREAFVVVEDLEVAGVVRGVETE